MFVDRPKEPRVMTRDTHSNLEDIYETIKVTGVAPDDPNALWPILDCVPSYDFWDDTLIRLDVYR